MLLFPVTFPVGNSRCRTGHPDVNRTKMAEIELLRNRDEGNLAEILPSGIYDKSTVLVGARDYFKKP
jgi:hypothetical protein